VDLYGASYNDLPLFRSAEVYLNFAEAKAELGTLTQSDLDKSIKLLRDRVGMQNIDLAAANASPDPYLMAEETGYPNVNGENLGVILEIRRERTIELFDEKFRFYDLIRWKNGQAITHKFLGMYFPAPGAYDLDGNGTLDVCFYTDDVPSGLPANARLARECTSRKETTGTWMSLLTFLDSGTRTATISTRFRRMSSPLIRILNKILVGPNNSA